MFEFVSQASFVSLALACSAFLVSQNALWSAFGAGLERSSYGRAHPIWKIERKPGQLRWEFWANLRFDVIVGVGIAAALASGAIVSSPSGDNAGSMILTFGVCWVSFEIYYWLLHRAMHTRPFYRFHRFHHDSRVTTPLSGNSTSAVEALGWLLGYVLAPMLLSLAGPISLEGLALYLVYNYSGNIVGHVNVEFVGDAMRERRASWLMHPIVYHALHHARFVNHYGFGSTFMDRLLGTEWGDWPKLHARVRSGAPLTRFAERG